MNIENHPNTLSLPDENRLLWQTLLDNACRNEAITGLAVNAFYPSTIKVLLTDTHSSLIRPGTEFSIEETPEYFLKQNQESMYFSEAARCFPVFEEMGIRSCHVLPLRWPDGTLFGSLLALNTDRNQRSSLESVQKMLEIHLEALYYRKKSGHLRKKMNEFQESLSFLSHEWKEPLRVMTSFALLVKKRLSENRLRDEEELAEYMDFILESGAKMEQMTEHLLKIHSMDSRRISMTHFPLQTALDAVFKNLKLQMAENNARIVVYSLPQLEGDFNLITHLFQNIISNGIKYQAPENLPLITISAEPLVNELLFTIKDNGIGIENASGKQVFDLFTRLHPHHYSGSGLGLTLAKKIVQLHGGKIWFQSSPGKGTAFHFTLSLPRST
jgi:signal transduction histidine kinase